MWGAELLWELPAFSVCFSSRGPFPIPFFFCSVSPERSEVILSGHQSLSLRGLKGAFSKMEKAVVFPIATLLSLKHVKTRVTDHYSPSACRPLPRLSQVGFPP